MSNVGEVSIQEIMGLVETAREYLGPMWIKKNIKAAANLPVKGLVNRKQLSKIHPLGLLFREVEKIQETVQKGKPLSNAATLLMVAGLGRNLKNLEMAPGFPDLVEQLKQVSAFADAALLAEISAHWQKLGYQLEIVNDADKQLYAVASSEQHTFHLQSATYTFLPGHAISAGSSWTIESNFIYSSWWEAWTAELVGSESIINTEVETMLNELNQQCTARPGTVFYLDLPPYTTREDFIPILAAGSKWLLSEQANLTAIILSLPQHLPHLYVRHTLPIYAPDSSIPLPKSLLNTLSY